MNILTIKNGFYAHKFRFTFKLTKKYFYINKKKYPVQNLLKFTRTAYYLKHHVLPAENYTPDCKMVIEIARFLKENTFNPKMEIPEYAKSAKQTAEQIFADLKFNNYSEQSLFFETLLYN